MTDNKTPAQIAAEWLAMRPVFLDTETTGLGDHDQIVSIAVVDTDGTVLLDTLVRPVGVSIPRDATAIHGITEAMVKDAPTFDQIADKLGPILSERQIIIYNADYDTRMIEQSTKETIAWSSDPLCAMLLYAEHYGEWNDYYGNYRWQRLEAAARQCKLQWRGQAHGALADADMTRQIIHHMAAQAVSNG